MTNRNKSDGKHLAGSDFQFFLMNRQTIREKYPNTNMAIPHPGEKQASDRMWGILAECLITLPLTGCKSFSNLRLGINHSTSTVRTKRYCVIET